MSDPLQHTTASTGAEGNSVHHFFQRMLRRTQFTVATSLQRVSLFHLMTGPSTYSPSPAGATKSAETTTADQRLRYNVRLIAVLSVLLASAETGRALYLLHKQTQRYNRHRKNIFEVVKEAIEKNAGRHRGVVTTAAPRGASSSAEPEKAELLVPAPADEEERQQESDHTGKREAAHRVFLSSALSSTDDNDNVAVTGGGVLLALSAGGEQVSQRSSGGVLLQTQRITRMDEEASQESTDAQDEEDEEVEYDGDGDADSGDDDYIHSKTPLQLVHYWKQMEKAILTSSNRQPFGLPLPESTFNIVDPQAKKRQKELIRRPLSATGILPAGETLKSPSPSADLTMKRSCGGRGLDTLVLPIEGCFLYEHRPDVFDFAWREADESEEQRIKLEEEEEARAHRGGGKRGSSRRPGLPPSASSRGLLRFSTSDQLLQSSDPLSAPLQQSPPLAALQPHDAEWRPPLKWEALFLVWGLSVDYSITIREVRQLLLSASPPAFLAPAVTRGDGPTAFDLSSANLSLLWFLANLRLVYTAIIVHGDIQKCTDEMDELDTYMSVIYKKCIARWPTPADMSATWQTAKRRNNVWLVCAVCGSWQVLSAAYDELLSIRFRQSVSGVWQLAKYMYASSKTKYVSAVLIAGLTALNSRVTSAGRLVREEINTALSKATGEPDATPSDGGSGGRDGARPLGLGMLCCCELGRLVLNYVLVRVTNEFIALTAGLRKDTTRAELYEALAHMPLSYFDVRTFDEVEGMIYSVDDLEGIDVQINQYVFSAANTLWMLREALSDVHNGRVLLVAATTASLPHVVECVGKQVRLWYDDLLRAGAFPWFLQTSVSRVTAEEEAFNTDGVLLRGSEIIGAVHQLRPYGADTRLTHWWNHCTQYEPSHPLLATEHNNNSNRGGGGGSAGQTPRTDNKTDLRGHPTSARASAGASATCTTTRLASRLGADVKESGHFLLDAVRRLMQMPYGKLIPGVGKGVLDLTNWLLPIILNDLGARWCGLSPSETFRLMDCASAMESGVNTIAEGVDMVQMLLENGYKAAMLERVLDAACWETTSTEENRYLLNYVNTHDKAATAAVGVRHESGNTAGAFRPACSCNSTFPLPFAPPLAVDVATVVQLPASRTSAPLSFTVGERRAVQGNDDPLVDVRRAALYRHYLINKIHFRNIQFRYPSAPTVDTMSVEAFTATIHLLREPHQQALHDGRKARRGHLVCITGPSGCGKTTLLHLILALYSNYASGSADSGIDVEFLRRGRGGGTRQRYREECSADPQGHPSTNSTSLDLSTQTNSLRVTPSNSNPSVSAAGHELATYREIFFPLQGRRRRQPERHATGHSTPSSCSYHRPPPRTLVVDVRQIPVDVLRCRLFSYVPQVPTIFSGATIAQNISLAGFVSIATDSILEKVEHCAALACCGPFVKQLPAGLLTRVCDSTPGWCNPAGADGRAIVRLAPDQLQRIMIARALYHGGQVLLMDEPTASLEKNTAAALRVMWLSLLDTGVVKGIICATHDPELLAAADQVITLPS